MPPAAMAARGRMELKDRCCFSPSCTGTSKGKVNSDLCLFPGFCEKVESGVKQTTAVALKQYTNGIYWRLPVS